MSSAPVPPPQTPRRKPRFTGLVKPHEAFPAVARLDRRMNDRTYRRQLGPRADAALVRLTTAANHSVLWMGLGAGLAATGARGRRAAVRGLVSVAAASATANLLGKGLFGGDRPSADPLPLVRRLRRYPTTPSFPSGHSATAGAFAAGVALEWPAAGLVVAPVAGAVMYSRLHVGAHWFSDVVGGAAIGVGLAALGRWLVPSPPGPEPDVPAGPPTDVPALPDGEGLFVVVNTAAGSGRILKEDPLEVLHRDLPKARVHVLAEGDDLREIYDRAARGGGADSEDGARPARALGISGGDGTVATAAAAARDHDLPLVVFPGGTLNHFAKAADLTSMSATVDAVRTGSGVSVDVAELRVDGHDPVTVLNTFSLGIYPELVSQRERAEKRLGKWPATVWATARVLRSAAPLKVSVDGVVGSYWSFFAGVNTYVPQNLAPVERVRLDDGVLDVRTGRAEKRYSRARLFLETVAGGGASSLAERVRPLERHLALDAWTTPDLSLRLGDGSPHDPVILAHDGETLELDGDRVTDATLTMVPGGLRVYAPTDPAAG
ncbi:bifunctional phosphatase PAP2/diacylglycerol kinase family protein [Oerskovia sp. KBS0722]|uniref:bifunctional phosphatase PAP2/diacylglycerol kinase family protein n=1 Tax=Oerskovia sp. KBS0722 TaxID=1179673 RepID=UPI00110DB4A1|nr:bifunctional phosphatase PAP2/diacylglycerol kinase family protein [Oerskovia sp. KBS0722]QDW61852.1 phosphatase PAP2 family protein [Oerskovia sp. KBS0722]